MRWLSERPRPPWENTAYGVWKEIQCEPVDWDRWLDDWQK